MYKLIISLWNWPTRRFNHFFIPIHCTEFELNWKCNRIVKDLKSELKCFLGSAWLNWFISNFTIRTDNIAYNMRYGGDMEQKKWLIICHLPIIYSNIIVSVFCDRQQLGTNDSFSAIDQNWHKIGLIGLIKR